MPLSAKDLYHYGIVNEPDFKNSRYVKLLRANMLKTRPEIQTMTQTVIPGEKPRFYRQRIYTDDLTYTGRISRCPDIKISCSCPRFKFKWEFSLAMRYAADIIFSNGEYPVITNPSLKIGACKHCIIILNLIIQRNL